MYLDEKTNRPKKTKTYLVCGAPASGKTSYVTSHKAPGDFVLDLDVIRQALGAPDKTSDCFQPQVMAIRDVLFEHISFNRIGVKTAWVIAGLPNRYKREALARKLGAEIIFIATPFEECITRAMNDPERKDKEKQRQIITQYFQMMD